MLAAVCNAWGLPKDLKIEDIPEPSMGPRGVKIEVCATGINFADSVMIKGTYQRKPSLPFVPGMEVAGTVVDCADDVSRFKPGDRVMATIENGAYAEVAVAEEDNVNPIPQSMDFVTAASIPVAYGTAHLGLKDRAHLADGETLLVLGASGGVGRAAVEVGKILGASVIAAAGGADKLAIAKAGGADHLIDYKEEDLRQRVKDLTNGRGADVVFDPVGGDAFKASLRCVAPGARMLIVGFASGEIPQVPANILLVKNVSVIGYTLGGVRVAAPRVINEVTDELIEWCEKGLIVPHVSKCFPLKDAAEALDSLNLRKSTGKVVLTMK
jgi:NADPH:quinone reductase